MTMIKASRSADSPAPGAGSRTESLRPEAAGAPMHSSDALVSLRLVGTKHELRLPSGPSFRIGTGPQVELRVPTAEGRQVSREHARLTREGADHATWLRVVDLGSKNGTSFRGVRQDDFAVCAGQRFKVAATELVVMDQALVGLRRVLGGFLGFAQHQQLDDSVAVLQHEPLLLIGDRGAERGHLAEAVHGFSRRRHRRFVEIGDPEQSRAALATLIDQAAGGTVFVSLDRLPHRASLAPLIGLLFSQQCDLHPIFAARSLKEARGILDKSADLFRPLTIPPLTERRDDIAMLLHLMLKEQGSPHGVTELHIDRLRALTAYEWPRNRAELRETAARLASLLAHGGNLSAAAAAIDQDYETYRRALARVGAIAVRHRE